MPGLSALANIHLDDCCMEVTALKGSNGNVQHFAERGVRYWRAFPRLSETVSRSAGLAGWRRSADRTGLHTNSLLIGNFTGNFAMIRPNTRYEQQEITVLQPLPEQFPTEPIKEKYFD